MGQIQVKTNGQTLVLSSFTNATGTTCSIYSDAAQQSAVTLPATVSADTTYYALDGGQFIPTLTAGGVVVFSSVVQVTPQNPVVISPLPTAGQVAGSASRGASIGGMIPSDFGLSAGNFPVYIPVAGAALTTAGTVYGSKIWIPAGIVTNVHTYCITAGNTLTSAQCFAGLFDSSRNLLSATAYQSTAWASTGKQIMALTSPQTVAAGYYHVGFFFNGTTGPAFAKAGVGASGQLNYNVSGNSSPNWSADTLRTTSFPATLGTLATGSNGYWVAVS